MLFVVVAVDGVALSQFFDGNLEQIVDGVLQQRRHLFQAVHGRQDRRGGRGGGEDVQLGF